MVREVLHTIHWTSVHSAYVIGAEVNMQLFEVNPGWHSTETQLANCIKAVQTFSMSNPESVAGKLAV
jgi:hypothetical protein